jgi:hypothetical protein
MFRSAFFKFLISASFLAFMFCNKDSGVSPPEGVKYGSISGKVIHPDNNLLISVIAEDGIDTTIRDPESQMFFFDSVKCGKCIIHVSADSFALFEQMLILDKPLFICHDIVLAQFPGRINFVYPSNSQYFDSVYLGISSPSVTDSGFWCFINFNAQMDTASVNEALALSPDTVGIQKIWTLTTSLSLYYTYWRLSTIDTVKVKIGRMAMDMWGDTLERDFMIFFPVDTTYIRKAKLK